MDPNDLKTALAHFDVAYKLLKSLEASINDPAYRPPTAASVSTSDHETPNNPGDDMVASVANVKRSLSPVILRAGTKRPAVMLFQQAMTSIGHSLDADCWYGTKTAKMMETWQKDHGLDADGKVGKETWTMVLNEARDFQPALMPRVMEYIAWCETGAHQDVYGMAENDIGDGAGANYGLVQHNNYGSMDSLLRQAGNTELLSQYHSTDKSKVNYDIKDWMGSVEGIKEQNKYFERVIFNPALAYIPDLGPMASWSDDPAMTGWYERLVCMLCDSRVQNGGIWSSAKPFWKGLTDEEAKTPRLVELFTGAEWNASILGKYALYGEVVDQKAYDADDLHVAFTPGSLKDRWYKLLQQNGGDTKEGRSATYKSLLLQLMEEMGTDYEAMLVLLAQFRARTSSSRWWKVVEARRMMDATGSGVVNGRALGLYSDFGIGHED